MPASGITKCFYQKVNVDKLRFVSLFFVNKKQLF